MFDNVSSGGNDTSRSAISIPKAAEALTLAIGILSVLFNGTLLIVMTLNSRQVFASLGSYFIANLAVADLITGLNSIGWGMNGFHPFSLGVQKALLCVFWITVQVSFYTILVMSTERLIAIVFPFRAALLMSKKKTVLYCVAVWIVAIICAVFINLECGKTVMFALIVFFELAIIAIVIEYVFVFRQLRALWQHSKKRVLHGKQSSVAASGGCKETSDVQREYQVTVVVVTLAVILVLTVFPYNLATQVYLACELFRPSACVGREEVLQKFMWYYFPIELLNFVLNPVVYAWRLPKYRKAFLVTFGLQKSGDGWRSCSSGGSPKTTRSTCPNGNEKRMVLLNCK